jgi:predicted P-loop ATPase
MESTSGKLIVEAGELKGMTKGDVNKLKGYLSRTEDKARMAYGRKETISPRQFIIIGTTNDAQYLRDPTGNRRFWPVKIIFVDVDAIKRDRDQIWAEAAYYESQGESVRLHPSLYGMAAEEQEERRVVDTIEIILEEALAGKVGRLKSTDIWALLGKDPIDAKPEEQIRMGDAMRRLGWESSRPRVNGQRTRFYMKGDDQEREIALGVSGRKVVRLAGIAGGLPGNSAPVKVN